MDRREFAKRAAGAGLAAFLSPSDLFTPDRSRTAAADPRDTAAPARGRAGTLPFPDYEQYDALGLAELVRSGKVSTLELLEAAFARADARNSDVNAVVFEWRDRARRRVRTDPPEGPFQGVPFLLKNLGTEVEGTPLDNGSRLFSGHRAEETSRLVRRYRSAGLVDFGRGNAPEFGITATTEPAVHGPSHNPWDLSRTPGGSSGGAAAAVAAGIVPMAYASDGGGSTRIPASCCGLVGMKPTRGRTPVAVGAALGQSLVVSRSVRDTAAALDAVRGGAPGAAFVPPAPERPFAREVDRRQEPLRIAFSTASPHSSAVDDACQRAVEEAAGLCRDLGHEVVEARPDYDFGRLAHAMFKVLMATRVAGTVADREDELGREARDGELENYTRAMAEYARELDAVDHDHALSVVGDFSRRFASFFREHDVHLTPTLGRLPLPLGTLDGSIPDEDEYLEILYGFMPYTMQYNASGQPAISLPLHWSRGGLPVGVQFGAGFGRDAALIRLAAQLEEAKPWFDRRSPVAKRAVG